MRLSLVFSVAAILAVGNRADELDDDMDFDSEGVEDNNNTQEALMQQAAADFESMDMDKDGKLSAKDLEEYLNDPEMTEEIKEFIEKADTDGDSFVSLEEYTAFVHSVMEDYQANGGGDEEWAHEGSEEDLDDDEEL